MTLKYSRFWVLLSAAALLGSTTALAQVRSGQTKAQWGAYLVEEVAKCQDCHTNRLADGKPDRTQWMKGTTLNIAPLAPVEDWHKASPDITPSSRLWAKWGDDGMLNYLKTGLTPRGRPAGPPMPAYKLNREDAEAVLEYLKTLK